MALALYRKYRPRTFAEVIGQEHVTEPLTQALRSGRLHHAYLFSGPRGCGKTSSARILARSLNCERGPTPEPCGVCDSCKSLATEGTGSIDVIEIDAASHGGVDDARELRERAFFAPAMSRFKIYVIDEAHMVSTQGFNALLKLVEEPPDYVKFIFATTEPDKVLGTIKSRTHHYPFRLIPPGVLRPYLEQLASAEGAKVESAVFPLVVRAGGGSARDALSVLDQLIAGAGPEGVSYARAVALLGVTDAALIDEMCDALAAGDGASAFATIDRVAEAGHDPRRFASDLLERLRDLIILQQVPDAVTKGLIDGPADQLERMAAQSQRLGPATLSRGADIVHNGLVEMRGTTAPRLLLELITARMLLPAADQGEAALMQRMERMERRLTIQPDEAARATAAPASRASAPSTPPSAATAAPAPAPASAPAPPASGASAKPASPPVRPGSASVPPASASPSAPPVRPGAASAPPATASPGPEATAVPAPPSAPVPATAPEDTAASAPPASASRPAPRAVMDDPATPEPVIPHVGAAGQVDVQAVRAVWDSEILPLVRRKKQRVAAVARDAVVRDIDGDTLILLFQHSFHAQSVSAEAELISDAAYEVLGVRWQVRCELSGDQSDPAPRSTAAGPTAPAAAPRGLPAPAPARGRETPTGREPHSGGGTRQPAAEDGDDDWPEPARPGGPAATTPEADGAPPATTAAPQPAPDPRTAPGAAGDPRSAARAAAAAASAGTASPDRARPTADSDWAGEPPFDPEFDGPGASTTARPATAARLTAPAAAAPAAPARSAAAAPAAPSRPTAAAPGSQRRNAPEPTTTPAAARYEGFDPGDEPTDEVIDEQTARQTSEQQALQLLQQALGAERIGEVELK